MSEGPPGPPAGPGGAPQPPAWGSPAGPTNPPPAWGSAPGGAQRPWYAFTVKPGIIPLRPLSVGEILDGAFSAIRRNPKATLGMSAIVATVLGAVSLLLNLVAGAMSGSSDTVDGGDLVVPILLLVVTVFMQFLLTTTLTGLLAFVISDAVLARQATIGRAWSQVRPRIWALLGASIAATVITLVGLALCLVPGVWLGTMFSLATPALVLEKKGVRQALSRSWDLVSGSFWRVLGIVLLGMLLSSILAQVVAVPFNVLLLKDAFTSMSSGSATTDPGTADLISATFGSILGRALSAPISAGVVTLLYVDRRMRAEAFDVTLQQALAAQSPTTPG